MTPQERIVARLRRIVRDAEKVGLRLVADGEMVHGGIRVMTAEEMRRDDIRGLGVTVPLHDGCGFDSGDRSGGGKWM